MSRGDTRCCGCKTLAFRSDSMVQHGHSTRDGTSPEYNSWSSMRERCTNSKLPGFADYGGRGITVCDRWRHDFAAFLADMGPRPAGTTIDRINNDGNYEPGNCRWATQLQQARNSRHNVRLTLDGVTLCLSEWAERLGFTYSCLMQRVVSGWSVRDALTLPTGATGKRVRARGTYSPKSASTTP